jgi:hypothetical protein
MTSLRLSVVVAALVFCFCGMARAQGPSADAPSNDDPKMLLQRAKEVMRFRSVDPGRVLHYHAGAAAEMNFQSDRSYPPFFLAMEDSETWLDLVSGEEHTETRTTFPGAGPTPPQSTVTDASRAFALQDKNLNLLPETSMQERYLNPWTVLRDWSATGNVRFMGRERYRDYERVVLARSTPGGEQRLFLDPKSGFPVKLDFEEPHYLWGQRHVEYVYTTWLLNSGVMISGANFRLTDGAIEISQTIGDLDTVERGVAALPTLPAENGQKAEAWPKYLQPIDPQVTQIGPKTYLLKNPGYQEAVTAVGDEVFLFDATQGEERSRKDAAIIDKLFPEHKKVTVVVSDLAWPHIAGVRYWVANGATIVAHKGAREFLQSVVDRHWTLTPDLLEQRRARSKFNFVGVDAAFKLAPGISLHPIDGVGSEVALIAYLEPDRFLWASDFIQTAAEPTSYGWEVWRATQRDGIHPERTAAEHLPLTPWSKIEELAAKEK